MIDKIHFICRESKGYNFEMLWDMPVTFRDYIFDKTNEYIEKQNEKINNQSSKSNIISPPIINGEVKSINLKK